MFNHEYPYNDMHEFNLDSLIQYVKGIDSRMSDFEIINSIKWRGEWDINTAYGVNSIVDNNEVGYISIKPVPSGIEIGNTDYWLKIANYSGLYAEVEIRLDELTARLTADEARYNANLSTLNGDVATLKFHDDINRISNMFLISDSYGMSDTHGGWLSKCKTKLEHATNVHVSYDGRSGYGFVGNDGQFIQILRDKHASMSADERNRLTHIVVGGGWNDYNKSNQDIGDAIGEFIEYARTNFPNAKVYVAFIGWDTQASVKLNNALFAYRWYPVLNGARYINNSEFVARNMSTMNDTRHPNDAGYENIARFIANFLLGGGSDYRVYNVPMSLSGASNVAGLPSNAYQWISNNIVTCFMTAFTLTLSNFTMIFDNNHPYVLGDVNGGALKGNDLGTSGIDVPVVYRINNTLYYGNARLCIRNRKLVFIPMFMSGVNTTTAYTVTNIYFPIIQFVDDSTIE